MQLNIKKTNNPIQKWAEDLHRHFSKEDIQIASKHVRRCSTLYVIRKMQIRTAMWYHYKPTEVAKIQNTDDIKCWQECGATRTPIYSWWECKMVQLHWKTVWQFLRKLPMLLCYGPTVTVLGIYPKQLKTYVHTYVYTWMFIAISFIIAKTKKQPKCLSVDEWIKKLWNVQVMGYHLSLKRNELSSHGMT